MSMHTLKQKTETLKSPKRILNKLTMNIKPKSINCFDLDIIQDIPLELVYYKNHCQILAYRKDLYKKVLFITSTGFCLYILYQTLKHYSKQKKTNHQTDQKKY